jgi:hypothetical protein
LPQKTVSYLETQWGEIMQRLGYERTTTAVASMAGTRRFAEEEAQ